MARVLVSGASGPIGRALLPTLSANGAHITRLVRNQDHSSSRDEHSIPWDPERPFAPDALSGFDAVIHLAGETIVGRWSEAKKKKIRDSRVDGTRHVAEALAEAKDKPQAFICSSAIGYYGNRGDEMLTEESAPGSGFLPDVCREWESATRASAEAGIRTVLMRTGVVLSREGGALGKMLPAFKMGVGGKIGDGRQWMSWIDVQDLVGAIHHILKSDLLHGPVNMVAPKPVTNAEFTRTLASVLSRPAIFPVPAPVVKFLFGEMGETVLLGSQRVEPTQLVSTGYPFRFRNLRASLENTLKR
ncbi:MAG TPA: TIGR01777 family oxidoreductase [Candidatus Sulfotelmatobacter sp.]|nr:TIGR01777 family oxidoreductase [Candidatus Sulfotelmatobacter sp.]